MSEAASRVSAIGGVRRALPVSRLGPGLAEVGSPPIRAAWIEKGNPASQNPRSQSVREALRSLDLLVVVDQFLTDTARYADVLLPATTSLEHADLYRSYGHYCVQRAEPAIPPVGQSRSNWEVFQLLAAAMGFEEPVFRRTAREMVDELLASRAAEVDPFDRIQLEEVLRVCQSARSLSEAGRKLFAVSRTKKSSSNDADRLRKYLARFGLAWGDVSR